MWTTDASIGHCVPSEDGLDYDFRIETSDAPWFLLDITTRSPRLRDRVPWWVVLAALVIVVVLIWDKLG